MPTVTLAAASYKSTCQRSANCQSTPNEGSKKSVHALHCDIRPKGAPSSPGLPTCPPRNSSQSAILSSVPPEPTGGHQCLRDGSVRLEPAIVDPTCDRAVQVHALIKAQHLFNGYKSCDSHLTARRHDQQAGRSGQSHS